MVSRTSYSDWLAMHTLIFQWPQCTSSVDSMLSTRIATRDSNDKLQRLETLDGRILHSLLWLWARMETEVLEL